jgi:glycine dehydrogenase
MTQVSLTTANEFIARHIGPRAGDEQRCSTAWADSLEALSAVIPQHQGHQRARPGRRPGEAEALADQAIAGKNQLFKTYIGQGYYPATRRRHPAQPAGKPGLVHRLHPVPAGDFQGRMEALLNFQTLISDLTGLPIANASLLDEATAAAEAMTFCKRLSKNKGSHLLRLDALPPADPRRAAHPCRAAGHRSGGR